MNKVIVNISSYNRKETLIKTVDSVYNQCDVINIALNDYNEIPKELIKPKINIVQTNNEKGDAYKFMWLEKSEGYYITIDDDLIFQKDYIKNLIEKIDYYNKKCIITYHGRNFKSYPITSYYKDKKKEVIHFREKLSTDKIVTFGGTGVMGFHTDLFKVNLDYFKFPNMADIWIGKYAKENNINIICVEHDQDYIVQQEFKTSIRLEETKDDKLQTEIVNDIFNKEGVSVIVPTYKNVKYIDDCINSILKSCSDLNFEILVGIDGCNESLEYLKNKDLNKKVSIFYFNENKGPYTIKNTLTKYSTYNNIIFFDSDDIMLENMVNEILRLLKSNDVVQPKLENFSENNGQIPKKFSWGEGVIGIKKNIFLKINGYEPWVCAADSDLLKRLKTQGHSIIKNDKILFRRRIHSEGLTSKKTTGFGSSLREKYKKIWMSKTGFENPDLLNVRNFNLLNSGKIFELTSEITNFKNSNITLSIIIATYKNTKYIDECIDSVIESTKNQNVEILVGIDGCKETLEYVKQKSYPDNIKFYYFEKNVGPYIIKNSLSEIAIGENLIFFDSDDIMTQDMVSNSINSINHCDFIRHSYVNFTDPNKLNENKKREFEGGIFTIKKEVFEYMNGFEPWKCEADSEFALRMSKSKYKTKISNNLDFFRRIHNEGLTSRTDTGYRSKLRAEYRKLYNNKKTFGPLPKKVTEPFTEIVMVRSSVTPQPQEPVKEKNHTLLSKLMNVIKIDPQPVQEQKTIDYDGVNETLRKREIQKQEPKPISKNSNKGMAQNIKVSKNMNRPILLPKKPGDGSYRA
jgi:glycosyltransferase involved in cell wall biosynthesis